VTRAWNVTLPWAIDEGRIKSIISTIQLYNELCIYPIARILQRCCIDRKQIRINHRAIERFWNSGVTLLHRPRSDLFYFYETCRAESDDDEAPRFEMLKMQQWDQKLANAHWAHCESSGTPTSIGGNTFVKISSSIVEGTVARATDVLEKLNSWLTFSDILQHDGHRDSFLKRTDKRFMKKKLRHWFQVEEKSPFSEARILSYFESHFKQDEKKCCQCYFIPSCASAFGDKISVHNSAMNLLMRHDVTMLLKISNFHFREIEIIKKL